MYKINIQNSNKKQNKKKSLKILSSRIFQSKGKTDLKSIIYGQGAAQKYIID